MPGFISEDRLWRPRPSEPYGNGALRMYRLIIDGSGGWSLFQNLLAALIAMGKQYGVGLGELDALCFAMPGRKGTSTPWSATARADMAASCGTTRTRWTTVPGRRIKNDREAR